MAVERVLLKCSDPDMETVACQKDHVYVVQDGYVHVDVRPYLATDPRADAQVDAAEILRVGGKRLQPLFCVPTHPEQEAWRRAHPDGPAPVKQELGADDVGEKERTAQKGPGTKGA